MSTEGMWRWSRGSATMGHGGSYQRPGAERGAGYTFASPGCWRLHAQRDDVEADAFPHVAA